MDNGGHHDDHVFKHGSNYEVPVVVYKFKTFLKSMNLLYEDIQFIKLDCEGMDLDVVEDIVGGTEKDMPIIQFEILNVVSDLHSRLERLAPSFLMFEVISDSVKGMNLIDLDCDMLRAKGRLDVMLIPKKVSEKY